MFFLYGRAVDNTLGGVVNGSIIYLYSSSYVSERYLLHAKNAATIHISMPVTIIAAITAMA